MSHNLYADLGYPDADEMLVKAQLVSKIAKLFRIGRSQAVRLPSKYRFSGDEVFLTKEGDRVILSAKPDSWEDFFVTSHRVPADFLSPRKAAFPQKRKLFK